MFCCLFCTWQCLINFLACVTLAYINWGVVFFFYKNRFLWDLTASHMQRVDFFSLSSRLYHYISKSKTIGTSIFVSTGKDAMEFRVEYIFNFQKGERSVFSRGEYRRSVKGGRTYVHTSSLRP